MSLHRSPRRPLDRARACAALALLGALVITALARPCRAASSPTPRPAAFDLRALDALDVATATARGWQPDARPVHVEAADSLHDDGSAAAWTYVFWSGTARLARAYTVRRAGAITVSDLAFPFDPPPVEDGWQDATDALARALKDPRAADAQAAGRLVAAVLTRGLAGGETADRDAVPRTTWLFVFGRAASAAPARALVTDALRGVVLEARAAEPSEAPDAPAGTIAGGRAGLPPWLSAHATLALTRLGELRDRGLTGARARWLTGRESASLDRLAAQDAELDSLGAGVVEAEGHTLDQRLAALAAWRTEGAAEDSTLARSASRIDACLKDLASESPTAIALYLSVTDHARPARVTLFVDGVEAARASYGDAEWRALDAGAWAEVARLSVRPGAHTVRVDIERADRRVDHVTWQNPVEPGRLSLLRLALSGVRPEAGGPAPNLELLSATAP